MRTLILALGLFAIGAQAQQIYRWVDADGKVKYTTEKPPAGAASSVVQPRVSAVGGNAAPAGTAPAPVAAAKPAVKMYMTDWCPYCRQAGEYFRKNGIAYTEHNIEKSEAAKSEYRALGGKGVPVILVGSQRMTGFSEQGMAAMLKAAGYH
jgi:glutaredoxin